MDELNPFAAVIDLETTGLSATEDVPLELGITIITAAGESIASKSWLIWEQNDAFQAGVSRGLGNEYVNSMHERTALWADLGAIKHADLGRHSRKYIDTEASKFILAHSDAGQLPMMGNSIGSLDRPFSIVHLPNLNVALSYRNIDVSTIREVCRAVNPELLENIEERTAWELANSSEAEGAEHRVTYDINRCILLYKSFLQNFLITGDNFPI